MPAAIPNRVATQLRIDKTLHSKAKIIAEREKRNINSQIEYFIQCGIAAYEREHGTIDLSEGD